MGFHIDLTRCWPAVRGKIVEFFCVKSGDKVFDYAAPDIDLPPEVQKRLAELSVRQFVMELKLRRQQVDVTTLELYVTAFVVKYGLGEYIRRAYHYILHRSVVNEEMIYYAGMIEKGVAPVSLLVELLNSEECKARGRVTLALPGDAQFPFYPA